MRFVGTTTQQWWSGGTREINQTFTATEDTPVTLSIDRVSEAGQGRPQEVLCGSLMKPSKTISFSRMFEGKAAGDTIAKSGRMETFQQGGEP